MAKKKTTARKTITPSKNLKQKNYALLALLVSLVVILFTMAVIKVDVSAAVNMK